MPHTPLLLVRSPIVRSHTSTNNNNNNNNTPLLLTQKISNVPSEFHSIITSPEQRNYRLGIILLLVSIATWITGLELVNGVLKTNEYKKPILFAVITGSCFVVNFVPDLALLCRRQRKSHGDGMGDGDGDVNGGKKDLERQPLLINNSGGKDGINFDEEKTLDNEMTKLEVMVLALQIAVIYLCYNIFLLEALQFTSASNSTVIGSTTAVFTLIIGYFLRTEQLSILKAICVVFSCLGVVLVNNSSPSTSHNDNPDPVFDNIGGTADDIGGGIGGFEPKNPKLGNILALAGAFLYACYLLIMRIKCGSSSSKKTNERRLFGYVGIMTIILGFPLLYASHIFQFETFELPPRGDRNIMVFILINGVFSVISDFTSILAMLLTSPLVTSLTLTSSIPITIIIDSLILKWNHEPNLNMNLDYILGITSILTAVVLVNFSSTPDEYGNDFLEESVLENVIINDEILSPILSPLFERPSLSTKPLTIQSPLLRKLFTSSETNYMEAEEVHQKVPMFNLNANDESPPTHNANHHPNLYHSPDLHSHPLLTHQVRKSSTISTNPSIEH
ncbi:hypothetical protein LELG_04526 [Lodderomyces elongisporus NRRL YB-4239]|uniref:EamA domain-containing protein n=1 Tax=Lodderomyces elongisporus (strain ATCC 11503 / CBS 2605 / JCM 1781 / NBRC 1676 / NRRL YB-4239) TaxID=379508 RepID=A5E4I7_LODEL|nr:hypothetical protein LELG_04526 [Lodderomyces elongisporus NRRL YB-4239]